MANIIDKTTDCVYEESREAANNDFDTRPLHMFPFKDMVWIGITFQGVTHIVILTQKTLFDAAFYIKCRISDKCIPIVNQDGNRWIGPDFTFQQGGTLPHTIETFESMRFRLSGPISDHRIHNSI